MRNLHYAVFAICFLVPLGVLADISQVAVTACVGFLDGPCGDTVTVGRGEKAQVRVFARLDASFPDFKHYGVVEIDVVVGERLTFEGCYAEEVEPSGPVFRELEFHCQGGDFVRINPYDVLPLQTFPVYDPVLLEVGLDKEMAEFTIGVDDRAEEGCYPVTLGPARFFHSLSTFSEPILPAVQICVPPPQCSDGIDNDGDDLTDLADPGCHGDSETLDERGECVDGLDNDGDNLVDFLDPGCNNGGQTPQSTAENNEVVVPTCGLTGIEAFLLLGLLVGAQRIMRQRF